MGINVHLANAQLGLYLPVVIIEEWIIYYNLYFIVNSAELGKAKSCTILWMEKKKLPLVWLEADDSMEKPLLDFVQHETAQKIL